MTTTRYEIRVQGEISEALIAALPDLEPSVEASRTTTVLRGDLRDQSELHGILQLIENLGIELVEVKQLSKPLGSRQRDTAGS